MNLSFSIKNPEEMFFVASPKKEWIVFMSKEEDDEEIENFLREVEKRKELKFREEVYASDLYLAVVQQIKRDPEAERNIFCEFFDAENRITGIGSEASLDHFMTLQEESEPREIFVQMTEEQFFEKIGAITSFADGNAPGKLSVTCGGET